MKPGILKPRVPASHIVLLLLAMSLFAGLTVYSAMNGPRGWDQYWYIADVESLAEGRGAVTNNIFPTSISSGEVSLNQPFVHNILNVYMAAPAAVFLGGHWGWIATNLVSTFLSVLLIYYLVRKVSGPFSALFAALLFLHMPLTFWLASQPLSEASTFMVSTAFIAILALAGGDSKRHMYALALAGLLFFCRRSFLPLLFLVPVLYLFNCKDRNRANAAWFLVLLSVSFLIILSADIIFPSGISWNISDILMTAIPGENAQFKFMFSLDPIEFSFSKWMTKALHMLKIQILPEVWSLADLRGLSYFMFFLPFDLLALVFFASLKPRLIRESWALTGIVFLLLHIMTIAVFNNQARYMGPIMPAIVISSSVAFFRGRTDSKILRSSAVILIVLIFASSLLVNTKMAKYSRAQGAQEAAKRERLEEQYNALIPEGDNVMTGRNYIILTGYLLRPRKVLFVNEAPHKPYTKEQYLWLARKVNTKWLVCYQDSGLPVILKDYVEKEADISDGLAVYRFIKAPRSLTGP